MSEFTLKNLIRGLGVTLILLSCAGNEQKDFLSPLYFDVNKVIDQQIELLDSLKPSLNKSLSVNNSREDRTITTVDWKKELEIFKEADINSPVLRETFTVKKVKEADGHSIHYIPLESSNKGVSLLVVTFNEENQLSKIYCKIISSDWLYSFERTLELHFEPTGSTVLKSYSINNSQEILFKKKEVSDLNGKIIFRS